MPRLAALPAIYQALLLAQLEVLLVIFRGTFVEVVYKVAGLGIIAREHDGQDQKNC